MKEAIIQYEDTPSGGHLAISWKPLVRCKDCKHGGCRTNNLDGSIYRVVCKKHSAKRNERWMDADWFCADGERREE